MGRQQDKANDRGTPPGGTRPGLDGPAPCKHPVGPHTGTNTGRPDTAATSAPATAGSGPAMRPPGVLHPGAAAQPPKPGSNKHRPAKLPRTEPAAAGKGPAAQGAGQQPAGPAGAAAGRSAPGGGGTSARRVPASSCISEESEVPSFLRGRAAYAAGGQSSDVTPGGLESLLGPPWRELRGAGGEKDCGGAGMRTGAKQGGDEACSGRLDSTYQSGRGADGGNSNQGGRGGRGPGRGSGAGSGSGGGHNHMSGRHSDRAEAPPAQQGRSPASAAPPPAPAPAAPAAPGPGPTATIRRGRPDLPAAAGPPQGRGGLPGGASGSGELARVQGGSCRVPAFLRKRWAVSALAEGATEEKTVYGRMADGSVVPYTVQLGSGGWLTGLTDLVTAVGANDDHTLRMTWEMVQAGRDGSAGGHFGVVVADAGPAAVAATGQGPAGAAAGTTAGAGGVAAAAASAAVARPKAGGGELGQRQACGGGGGPPLDSSADNGTAEPRRAVEQEAVQQQREQQGAAAPRWVAAQFPVPRAK